ncbi:EF-hand domain-containing protein [Prosthecobacter sp. SYSU 5D2]|uniref:EF-hand domain-containing protein n=1 Tax=Prosthecobacter sp. SYSU 5D2 TaxID=3134134 RepID=UPI0031FEDAF2
MAFSPLTLLAQVPATPPTDTTTTTTITTETPSGTATSVRTSNDNEAANQLLRNPEELFRRLDANADGILSMTEFQRVSALADGATTGRPSAASIPGTAPGTPIPSADTRVSPAPATGTAAGTNTGSPSR